MKPDDNRLSYQESYRRRLPHFQTPGAVIFVTFRLANSLPAAHLSMLQQRADKERRALEAKFKPGTGSREKIEELDKQHRREFGRWDKALDQVLSGPTWLKNPAVARIIVQSFHYFDGERYVLDAFCVMPNHVHLLIQPLPTEDGSFHSLSSIMHSLKGYSARKANDILGRTGKFWQHESFDRVVRSEAEWERVIRYILNNPVKAGFVEKPDEWPWSYYAGRR